MPPRPNGARLRVEIELEETEVEVATSKDGTRIAFDRSGDGPPIVLVGGALSDRAAAAELAGRLAPHLTAIAFDRRGRGGSGDTAPYAVDREVEDIESLILAVGGPAFLLGHSSGAVLALETARTHPELIARLALYEPPFIVDDSRSLLPGDYVTHLEDLVSQGRRGDAVAFLMTRGVGVPAEIVAGMQEQPFWSAFEAMAHTLAYDGTIMGDTMGGSPAPLQRWASVRAPALLMDGGASPDWQRHAVRALAQILPDARHVTLEGQSHGPDSGVLAPVLVDFLVGPRA
jgi:pimeloyl-ACP methyl ester carboxylesterase